MEDRPEGLERVDSITGCCMLVRCQVFEAIRRFNPEYFVTGEVADFCFRVAKQGFASAVVNHAKLWHKGTPGGYAPGRAYHTGRATMLFPKEHGRPWHWISTPTFVVLSLPIAYLR
jgi:GT2 family glycosyltransferase